MYNVWKGTVMRKIESLSNDIVKYIKSLNNKKNRDKDCKYIIEGYRLVVDALINNQNIDTILVSESVDRSKVDEISKLIEKSEHGAAIYEVTDKIIEAITDTKTPQGIVAIINKKVYNLNNLLNECKKIVVLDRVQDPGNLGTIIRTADAFGVELIVAIKGTVDMYSPKVVRASMGSIFHVPVMYADDTTILFNELKTSGHEIITTHLNATQSINEADISDKTVFVVGNEGSGVSDEVCSFSDKLVKIPMKGRAESLNVSIAASIVMYYMMNN